MITITEEAKAELTRMMAEYELDVGLRINVSPGGCTGYQYGLTFEVLEDGHAPYMKDVNGINVLVNPGYDDLLNGMNIDYSHDLMGSGFRLNNSNSTGGCGCGKSFSA